MPDPYTHKKLDEVKDSAPGFGVGDGMGGALREGRPRRRADRRQPPPPRTAGKRQPFGHKHEEAEEVYVVIAGSGRVKLDDEIVEIETLDAIRVSPGVTRAFEGGSEGIEVLAVGARHDGDGEIVQDWWTRLMPPMARPRSQGIEGMQALIGAGDRPERVAHRHPGGHRRLRRRSPATTSGSTSTSSGPRPRAPSARRSPTATSPSRWSTASATS